MEQGLDMSGICGLDIPCPHSERLSLRPLMPNDEDAIFDLLGDPEAMRFFPRTYTREEAGLWIARNQYRYGVFGYGLWAVVQKQSGEVLGDCGPAWHEIDDELQLEVGYHFRRRYWGHGYATEAARTVMHWCFDHIAVDHLISLIRPENEASRRVAERNGLVNSGKTTWRGSEHLIYLMERKRWNLL